jgi:hypothetical protein
LYYEELWLSFTKWYSENTYTHETGNNIKLKTSTVYDWAKSELGRPSFTSYDVLLCPLTQKKSWKSLFLEHCCTFDFRFLWQITANLPMLYFKAFYIPCLFQSSKVQHIMAHIYMYITEEINSVYKISFLSFNVDLNMIFGHIDS